MILLLKCLMHGSRSTSQTQHLLTPPATLTLDNNGCLTRSVRARLVQVTRITTLVITKLSPFGARLLAAIRGVGETLPLVTGPLALVHATGECLATEIATGNISQVARDVETHLREIRNIALSASLHIQCTCMYMYMCNVPVYTQTLYSVLVHVYALNNTMASMRSVKQ